MFGLGEVEDRPVALANEEERGAEESAGSARAAAGMTSNVEGGVVVWFSGHSLQRRRRRQRRRSGGDGRAVPELVSFEEGQLVCLLKLERSAVASWGNNKSSSTEHQWLPMVSRAAHGSKRWRNAGLCTGYGEGRTERREADQTTRAGREKSQKTAKASGDTSP